tara:strand:+ start:3669 stop:5015 length:1347 start_codon:yes stop_codon:yes gene_type:complete
MNDQVSERLLNYKNTVASKYLPVRSDQISSRVFDLDKYYISTKIDGHICFILKDKNNITIVNHNTTAFEREELSKEISNILKNQDGIFVGEIYFHCDDKRTRSYDLKKEISNSKSDIRIAVFDLLEHNNKTFSENEWSIKKELLKSLFPNSGKVYFLDEIELNSKKDIEAEFNSRVVDSNEEGLVVRGENGPVFKIKEYLSFDMAILGFITGYQNDSTLMKEILVGVMNSENTFLIIGVIANGFSISDREKLAVDFEKIKVNSDILQMSSSKIPFTMIEPKHVVEVESTDIINSTTNGIIKKHILKFDKTYMVEDYCPSVSLTTPVFTRFRPDKQINTNDIGLNQIERIIAFGEEKESESKKSPSKILRKELYVKEMKGLKMVKKFFIWETNSDNKEYPNYVYYAIDYSPSRATKLNRDIKVTNDKAQALKIFDDEIESNIKKGWNQV